MLRKITQLYTIFKEKITGFQHTHLFLKNEVEQQEDPMCIYCKTRLSEAIK